MTARIRLPDPMPQTTDLQRPKLRRDGQPPDRVFLRLSHPPEFTMTASSRSALPFRSAALAATFMMLAGVAPGFAAESAATDEKAPVPIVSTDEAVQKELLSLDRILETNPKLEETLRNNLDHLTDQTFREKNPEVDALLKRQPGLVPALRQERHFFIHRFVARLGRSRVTRNDVIALDAFLTAHPDISAAIEKKPSQIVNQDFLIAHPQLADFFEKHPALSSVLLQRAEKRQQNTKAAPEKK